MLAPAGESASPMAVAQGGKPELLVPAVPWEVFGAGEGELAAERQMRVISSTPKRRAGCSGCLVAGGRDAEL